jgi:glycosyltransferase involved in cell wall biosynthesis
MEEKYPIDNKIKVLHLLGSMELGGASKLVKYDVENTDTEVFSMHICCLGELGEYGQVLLEQGYSIQAFGLSRSWKETFMNIGRLINLFRHLKHKKIQVINAHLFFGGIVGRVFGKILCIPNVIHTTHNIMYPRWEPFVNRFLEGATNTVIVDSNAVRNKLVTMGQDRGKITVIYNGIDEKEFAQETNTNEIRGMLNISPNDIILGNIAGFHYYKGHDFLLDVFSKLITVHDNLQLILVGDGELRQQLVSQAKELKIDKLVHFLGRREDLHQILNTIDIMVHPSRWEGFGIILAEAMYCRIPIVTSDRGGIPEVVNDMDCGLVHPFGDKDAFVSSISRLINDRNLRYQLGENGRARVKKMFTMKTMMHSYSKIYRNTPTYLHGQRDI